MAYSEAEYVELPLDNYDKILDCGHTPGTFIVPLSVPSQAGQEIVRSWVHLNGYSLCAACFQQERDNRILDCGHRPSAHKEYSTGTAHTEDGREICTDCADKDIAQSLLTDSKTFLYLNGDTSAVTTWTGAQMGTVLLSYRSRHSTFGRAGYIGHLRVLDIHGQTWTGTFPIDFTGRIEGGVYCRLRKV